MQQALTCSGCLGNVIPSLPPLLSKPCRATLFVPSTTPHEFYEKYYEKGAQGAVKLYVRRVFITDDTGDDLLPRWLGFLRGIVDSDTLPLNVRAVLCCVAFCVVLCDLLCSSRAV